MVGQLLKNVYGCRVVGSAGSADKVGPGAFWRGVLRRPWATAMRPARLEWDGRRCASCGARPGCGFTPPGGRCTVIGSTSPARSSPALGCLPDHAVEPPATPPPLRPTLQVALLRDLGFDAAWNHKEVPIRWGLG